MAAQQMVEKAFLPVWLVNPELEQFLPNHIAQRLDPTGQSNPIYWKGHKKMHMIGHYDIPTNSNVMLLRLDRKAAECRINFIACQQALTFVSVECNKVKWPHIIEQTTEARRSSRPFFSVVARHGLIFFNAYAARGQSPLKLL
jgi:hypothetical protein